MRTMACTALLLCAAVSSACSHENDDPTPAPPATSPTLAALPPVPLPDPGTHPGLQARAKIVAEILVFTTYGSGTCPDRPEGVTGFEDGRLLVTMRPHERGSCTDDKREHTELLQLPRGVGSHEVTEIVAVRDGDPIVHAVPLVVRVSPAADAQPIR